VPISSPTRATPLRSAAALAALLVTACEGNLPRPFPAPLTLGGVVVPAERLDAGERAYLRYCRNCHGMDGDGRGPMGVHLSPPPRDLRLGIIKFASVPAGELPTDEDLARVVRSGLRGTAMLAWYGVSDRELVDIIQYVKSYSPRWREERAGEPVAPSPDPWTGREQLAAARGRKVYHGLARCSACHPAYEGREEVLRDAAELGAPPPEPRPDPGTGLVQRSIDFGLDLRAPDFARDELRSVRTGKRLEDLYRVVAAGVGGTSMPAWKGALPEEDLWALAHYLDRISRQ
jgi:mono/diheme cytochrome c family protein